MLAAAASAVLGALEPAAGERADSAGTKDDGAVGGCALVGHKDASRHGVVGEAEPVVGLRRGARAVGEAHRAGTRKRVDDGAL